MVGFGGRVGYDTRCHTQLTPLLQCRPSRQTLHIARELLAGPNAVSPLQVSARRGPQPNKGTNMQIKDRSVLLSIRQEADRQAAFYLRKLNDPLSQAWSDIGAMADQCIKGAAVLTLGILNNQGRDLVHPLPIKVCEQDQQLTNPKVIKAFR